MTPELEQLHADFQSVFGKEVPNNKKNDAERIKKKIAEANEISDQEQTEEANQAENTAEQEQEPELQNQDEEEEYSSEEDTQLSYEAKKISKIKYPL